mmetsp:Transcript_38049/g.58084  ORF Transcript_38049/g.58084 Transcript_38049/m.58084 type:complete len:104 (+) Transcript_38049:428-739(+)
MFSCVCFLFGLWGIDILYDHDLNAVEEAQPSLHQIFVLLTWMVWLRLGIYIVYGVIGCYFCIHVCCFQSLTPEEVSETRKRHMQRLFLVKELLKEKARVFDPK